MTEQERSAAVIQETIRLMRDAHIGWSKAMAIAAETTPPAEELTDENETAEYTGEDWI